MSNVGSRSFWKISGGVAGLLLLLAILFAANVILSQVRLRLDLTAERLYTLSPGTRSLLAKLEQPVTLKLFFNSSSPDAPVYLKNYAKQVEDLLREYRQIGGRRVVIETFDPKPDSDAEEWAQRYGLSGQSVNMFGSPIYFGLVAVAGNVEGSIPFLDPRMERLLEYNITRLIYRVAHPEKPVLGVISTLPVLGAAPSPFGPPAQRQEPWLAFKDLREDYTVRDLSTSVEQIPNDVAALLVIHPKDLPEKTLYAIDQFVLRGGRLMVFVDPLSVADLESAPAQQPFMRPESSSNLEKLFAAWGVQYDPAKVVADLRAVTRLRGANNQLEESPVFLSLGPEHVSREDALTAQLETLLLPFAGSFACEGNQDLTVTPLIRSSALAGRVDAMSAQFGAEAVRRGFKPEPLPLTIAMRLTGKFKTAFPDGKPKEEAADKEKDGEPKEAAASAGESLKEGTSAVLLVADTDLLYNRFCVEELNFFGFKAHRPLNDNLNYFANAAEQMAGSSDLIGIRSRGSFARPFTRVDALEEQARQEWQAREQALMDSLQQTRQQLSQLESQKEQNQRFILSAEQKAAITRFKQEELRINRELKEVRKNLRRDMERLGTKIKLINIALMPALVSLAGLGYGLYRKRHG
mgnify:CR=1 FL=1